MDTRAAGILPDKAKTHSALHAEADIYATLDSIVEETRRHHTEEEGTLREEAVECEMDEEEAQHFLTHVEQHDLDEDHAMYVVAAYLQDRRPDATGDNSPQRRRAWAQARELKRTL
eukprot:11076943-Lingulodinium_polyedra.AAC.1